MSQNSRNQGFSYCICLMIEGSGSGGPKNTWIRNTAKQKPALSPEQLQDPPVPARASTQRSNGRGCSQASPDRPSWIFIYRKNYRTGPNIWIHVPEFWIRTWIDIAQCCGSGFNGVPGSVSGSGYAIRIRIQEGFSCSLVVLYGGMGISKLQVLNKKRKKNQLLFFPQIFGHQNPGSGLDPDPDSLKMLDRIHNTVRIQNYWSGCFKWLCQKKTTD